MLNVKCLFTSECLYYFIKETNKKDRIAITNLPTSLIHSIVEEILIKTFIVKVLRI